MTSCYLKSMINWQNKVNDSSRSRSRKYLLKRMKTPGKAIKKIEMIDTKAKSIYIDEEKRELGLNLRQSDRRERMKKDRMFW